MVLFYHRKLICLLKHASSQIITWTTKHISDIRFVMLNHLFACGGPWLVRRLWGWVMSLWLHFASFFLMKHSRQICSPVTRLRSLTTHKLRQQVVALIQNKSIIYLFMSILFMERLNTNRRPRVYFQYTTSPHFNLKLKRRRILLTLHLMSRPKWPHFRWGMLVLTQAAFDLCHPSVEKAIRDVFQALLCELWQ